MYVMQIIDSEVPSLFSAYQLGCLLQSACQLQAIAAGSACLPPTRCQMSCAFGLPAAS